MVRLFQTEMVAAQGDWRNPLTIIGKGVLTFMKQSQIYDKPFKTYNEQIALMESRNIIIDDYDFTRRVLNGLSYYTIINGYKNTFLSVPGTDKFVEGTHFDNLYTLHIIDTNVNAIILKNILFIEKYLKTRISYIISEEYGVYTDPKDFSNNNPADYLCRNNYSRSVKDRNNVLLKIKQTLSSNRINASVDHYANTKNHIPAWILVTNITFGLTIKWYSILNSTDKSKICNGFITSSLLSTDEKKEFLKVSLSLLREYRNRIAHSNRTFNVNHLPVLPKKQLLILSQGILSEDEYNNNIGKSDLFAVILVCCILLDDKYILSNFLNDLIYILTPYKSVKTNGKTIFKIFGLPEDLIQRLQKFLTQKFQ